MTGPGPGRLAARTVTAVVAGMVAATAAATVVGFWLSYSGLHDFAVRAGLAGAQGWAWPASVDLFIAAGEAGVTISALRRRRDPAAWAYLALGFAASVTGNVLHVDTGHLEWAPYAVAAVPPMAAMLALAALLRHVYQLAIDRHAGRPKATASPSAPRRAPGPARIRARRDLVTDADVEMHFATDLASGEVPSARRVQREMHVGQKRARVLRDRMQSITASQSERST